MNVSAIIVTRGDVDLTEILDSLPTEWERLVWDNGETTGHPTGRHYRDGDDWRPDGFPALIDDLGVYGRYAAIEYASHDLIYVQDDDCVVSDPRVLVHSWLIATGREGHPENTVVCNMPSEFRHSFYEEHSLVGFGAVFHRDAPRRAFERFWHTDDLIYGLPSDGVLADEGALFHQTCDIVFTGLTPRILVDVPYRNLPWADADNRMWKQPEHQAQRSAMLEVVRRSRGLHVS